MVHLHTIPHKHSLHIHYYTTADTLCHSNRLTAVVATAVLAVVAVVADDVVVDFAYECVRETIPADTTDNTHTSDTRTLSHTLTTAAVVVAVVVVFAVAVVLVIVLRSCSFSLFRTAFECCGCC